MEKLNTRRNQT